MKQDAGEHRSVVSRKQVLCDAQGCAGIIGHHYTCEGVKSGDEYKVAS